MNGHSRIARQAGTSFLTADEERAAWEAGDTSKIITAHMHLAYRIASQFSRAWRLDAEELAGEAYLGLVRAAKKFDVEKGVRFHHYATFWCKALILKHIMDNWRMVKIGTTQTQRKLFFVLHSTAAGLEAQGEVPTAEILADVLDCTEDQIVEMQQRLGLPDLCLDAPLGTDSEMNIGEVFVDAEAVDVDEQCAAKILSEKVAALVENFCKHEKIKARDKEILYQRLFTDDPVTLREIGDAEGITRERVRQCESKLIRRLRAYIMRHAPELAQEVE